MSNPNRLAAFIAEVTKITVTLEPDDESGQYRQIVAILRLQPEKTLRHLFDVALTKVADVSSTDYVREYGFLWLLSHPTFEVFTAFISNDELVAEFIAYLKEVQLCRKKKWSKKTRKSKLLQWFERAKVETKLVQPYLALVRSSLGADMLCLNHRPSPTKLSLASARLPTLEEAENIRQHFLSELLSRELGKILWRNWNDKLYQIFWLTESALKEATLQQVVPEIYKAFGVPHVTTKREFTTGVDKQLFAVFQSVLKSGSWIRFSSVLHTVGDVKVSSEYKHRASEMLVSHLTANAKAQRSQWLSSPQGLLPVGLKLHSTNKLSLHHFTDTGFKLEAAESALTLPVVGNSAVAIELLRCLESILGTPVLNNPDFQIQVCSPGRLTPERAACLGIAFYLGSDQIRSFNAKALKTSHPSYTGQRIVIYGAGVCDKEFEWALSGRQGEMVLGSPPSTLSCRTDVLWCHSEHDINIVNLIASLLAHDQFGGYWSFLGAEFQAALRKILTRHELGGLLTAPWVSASTTQVYSDDELFATAFQELSTYALDEVRRLGATPINRSGILAEVQDLLNYCRTTIEGETKW